MIWSPSSPFLKDLILIITSKRQVYTRIRLTFPFLHQKQSSALKIFSTKSMFAGNWRRAFEKTNSVRNLLLFFPSCMLPSLTQLAEFKVWAKLSSSRCSELCSLRLSHGLPRCSTRSSIMDCAASLPVVFSCPALTCKSTIRRIIPSSFTAFQIWCFGWSFLLPLTASSIFCIITFSAISIEHLSFNYP